MLKKFQKKFYKMIEIVLDTETTGLSVKDGHRIVEIGCIELKNQIPTKRFFHCFLNPGRQVSEDAFKIHGYSDEFLLKKIKIKKLLFWIFHYLWRIKLTKKMIF